MSQLWAWETPAEIELRVVPGHPWRPPFGLDRIGRPLEVEVTINRVREPLPAYTLLAVRNGREIGKQQLQVTGTIPASCRVSFPNWPSELVVVADSLPGAPAELLRSVVDTPPLDADVMVELHDPRHPVELGTVLVPQDWLLLTDGQTGVVRGAAVCRRDDVATARVSAWFASRPADRTTASCDVVADRRVDFQLALPGVPGDGRRNKLHLAVETPGGERLWETSRCVMLVHDAPSWPRFGAVATRLRYDAPVSVRRDDGTYASLCYDDAWEPGKRDVVVSLPTGARFVFWRGSSYVPFWAGRSNTGLSYEWAETSPPPDGYTDCVEPLMDKELRYSRVEIIESTSARVHVRWSYESCDFEYRVWGDSAVEDFYFYPDGFGTRVLTLQAAPSADYELSEFIVLTPQATYPLSVLPPNLVDLLFLDGERRALTFPFFAAEQGAKLQPRDVPVIYRIRLHKDERLAAVYFHPHDVRLPPAIFAPFFDGGELVTPTYWGSHWPLARGKTTGFAIDERVHATPCHNSIMSWARQRPQPLRVAQLETLDTLGRSRPMIVQTWVWLIGMSDADDERLLQWGRSFATPPALVVKGARLTAESYIPERRAIRLQVEAPEVDIVIQPAGVCVHPVLELGNVPGELTAVHLGADNLGPERYAWDGQTLWLDATLTCAMPLKLVFTPAAARLPHPGRPLY